MARNTQQSLDLPDESCEGWQGSVIIQSKVSFKDIKNAESLKS